jgi:hypothetical protein
MPVGKAIMPNVVCTRLPRVTGFAALALLASFAAAQKPGVQTSQALRAVLVGAALISCIAATHAAVPPLPPRTEERLLLDRDFETLEGALRKSPPSPLAAERLFVLALTKLDAEAFYRLYDIAPEATKREAMTAAAYHGRVDLLQGLVKRGLDLATARAGRGTVVTTAARAGKIAVIEWVLKSGVGALPQDASDNELAAASQELAAASGPDQRIYAASAFRWLESRGFNPPLHPDAVVELTSNLVRFGDVGLLDRYVALLRTKNAFDPNAKRIGMPLVHTANTLPMLKYLEAQGATLDVPSVNEIAEKMRQAVSQMGGFFGSRPGRAASIASMFDAMGPSRRANPLENPGLDRDARLYLLSRGLRPQGDAVLYAILAAPTDFAMVDAMLKAGADLNAPRQNGRTTLHALVSAPLRNKTACTRTADEAQICVAETLEQRARIMRYLVDRGADPAQPDKNGTSALDAARKLSDEQRRLAYVGALSPKP